MQAYRIFIGIFICALFSTGCISNSPEISNQPLPTPDTTTSIISQDLLIGPMDTVTVRVFGVSDFDGDYQVDSNGNISIPLVGDIRAGGISAARLSNRIETALAQKYLRDPDVNVSFQKAFNQRVTVEGSVNNPNIYPIQGSVSLLQAVALAGGPSDGANPKKVVIFRTINGERKAAAYDLVQIRAGEANDPQIYGNDIVVVDGSEARATYGEILRSIPLLALFVAF